MPLTEILLLILGLVVLLAGAEAVVRGAVALAKSLGVSSLLIGLTVVAFGTSAPELAVGIASVVRGGDNVEFNVGNAIGSNIANVGLILGVTALVYPVTITSSVVRREIPQMIFVTLFAMVLMADAGLGRIDGALLLSGLAIFLWRAIKGGQLDVESEAEELELEREMGAGRIIRMGGIPFAIVMLVLGLAGLVGGAHLIINSATVLADALGVPKVIIGLSMVAFGTSLPELATCGVAALRKHPDIVMGNILGSNIFNLLCVLGVTGFCCARAIPDRTHRIDVWVMLALALVCVPIAATRARVSRVEGLLLTAVYVVYTVLLFAV